MKILTQSFRMFICAGTGIMPALSFYYNRPQWKNDPMGEGPVLRALVEMIDAPKYKMCIRDRVCFLPVP